jgi:Restriction endonuclease
MPETLSFKHLSDTDFEQFCYDLVTALGYVNIDWRKGTPLKTSPADHGRDIVCQELRTDLDGTKHLETVFIDCKHYAKGVPAREMQNLLVWAEAERPQVALFITSGFLSNAAKDYLDTYRRNNRPAFKVKYWERPTIERLTRRKKTLLRRYGLTHEPIRSIEEILKAENEFMDRIWYDRKLVLLQKLRDGTETITPDIKKGMLASMKRIEAKYGGRRALRTYYKDTFEWGMMNGKLSALRWILGDDWDMLDT